MRVGLVGNLLSLVKNALLLLLLLRLFATFVSGSSVRRSFAFNDFGCNAIAIVSCFLVISRQNPVFVGYFFTSLSEVFSDRDQFRPISEHNLVSVLKIVLSSFYNVLYVAHRLVHVGETLTLSNVLVENMGKSAILVTPHQINVTDIFSVEHTEQVATFMLHQEIKGFLHLALELVVDVSKHTTPYGLWFFIVHSLLRFLLGGFRLRSLLLSLLFSNALLLCFPFGFNTSFFLRLFCSNPLCLFLLCLNASLLLRLGTLTLLSSFPFSFPFRLRLLGRYALRFRFGGFLTA
ncbi:unknown [Prevotella sp. CAG:279]|nr:unknown [Prevotella sp. CAG:279]